MSAIDPTLLSKLNKPTPRYTSYPTAPEWSPLSPQSYVERLQQLGATLPLSLYFHIPFCKTMCLYCGCSVVLNRKEENEERYVAYLCREIDLVRRFLGQKRRVVQLHFGGGTPTKLSIPLLQQLFEAINSSFAIDEEQEISIEIDPRTVVEDDGAKLCFLRQLGFNRVSFGVQDTDPKVQKAVLRHQSLEMTQKTFKHARQLGFKGINIDLIYGLPFQTTLSFQRTLDHILEMAPDRLSLFSYAKIPWLKPHQKAIKEESLPSTEEKFSIYAQARKRLVENGYVAIGMDHFAKEHDELAHAYQNKRLQRNFQGYSLKLSETMLSFGITAIGFIDGMYVQNLKELTPYYQALDQEKLPITRGKILTAEDQLRKWVIHTLMCDFELNKTHFKRLFNLDFDHHFASASPQLSHFQKEQLLLNTPEKLSITPLGELFIRNIVTSFDAYLTPSPTKFSNSI